MAHFLNDEIFTLQKEFISDKRPNKINCGIGIYLDNSGKPYIPLSVRKAAKKLHVKNFNYLPIAGDPTFLENCTRLLFDTKMVGDIAKQGVMGGTNGVYIWGTFIKQFEKMPTILIGIPTWENHLKIFRHLNFKITTYKHLQNERFNVIGFKKALFKNKKAYLLFHGGSTHNPTGINPSKEEWQTIANLVKKNGNKVLFDFAYCGLGKNVEQDSFSIRLFSKKNIDVSVVMSFSKNMSLYQHRTGVLLIKARSKNEKIEFENSLQYLFRIVNSNPSAYGEQIASLILSTPELYTQWRKDISQMTKNLTERRGLFAKKTLGKFNYVLNGAGLFSLLRLTENQIVMLKTKYAIYLLSDGRINFGGLTMSNIKYITKSILEVVNGSGS